MKWFMITAEWLLFLYVVICLLSFNIIHLGNLLYVDMPHEEAMTVTTSFAQTSLFIIGIGAVCFYYMKYLRGSNAYKRSKAVIWGCLFTCHALASCFYLFMRYGLIWNRHEAMELLLSTVISFILTIQAVMKYYRC
ncbi:hypothetical protein M5J14_00090 [Lysinibacillus sp. OL1_EC]|nr:hypothetical protein [Lysinibacillus sp. OL1_EC]MCM0622916.1 hypothetical protein [Lysinibacillus sp. OL1_EC]TBV90153.1 hypothetical protein EW028_04280 [Lysinibacillus sp. OL1]